MINFDKITNNDDPHDSATVVRALKLLRKHEFFKEIEQKNYIIWAYCGKHFRNCQVVSYLFGDLSKEKMREAWKRRKELSTENKPNLRCKLNYSLAEQIRTEYSSGFCPEDLSIKYSVSKSTIHRIISRKIWIKQ